MAAPRRSQAFSHLKGERSLVAIGGQIAEFRREGRSWSWIAEHLGLAENSCRLYTARFTLACSLAKSR